MKDYTDISIVLDRSGSMESIKTDTIGGFNQFLKDQQSVPGKATITLVQFDHEYNSLLKAQPIAEAKPLDTSTYVPRGTTALLDAIGRTIQDTGKRLAEMPDADRPDKVVFVVITDGLENASEDFTKVKINEMIALQRDSYNWQFLFLGANQDAISAGQDIGVAASSSLSYAANSAGVRAAYSSLSSNIGMYRSNVVQDACFNVSDRNAQTDAGVDATLNSVP